MLSQMEAQNENHTPQKQLKVIERQHATAAGGAGGAAGGACHPPMPPQFYSQYSIGRPAFFDPQ